MKVLVLLTTLAVCYADPESYYWRDYTGTVPDDAIVGGKDLNGKNVYIGQAYVPKRGEIVVEVTSGHREVSAAVTGESVYRTSSFVKILCAKNVSNFYWYKTTAQGLQADITDKWPVLGGHENGSYLYVGRILDEGSIQIGKIVPYDQGHKLNYIRSMTGAVKTAAAFQILLVNGTRVF